IIDISKIEANLLNINKTEFNINHLLQEIHRTFEAVLQNKHKEHVKLIIETQENEDATIYSDKQRLTQILTNLVGNAVKFTDEGSITFGYKMKDTDTALFFVSDTGSGIDKEDAEVIFDRFVMAKNAVDEKHQGTGLGLAISKSLVELLGGTIWLEKTSPEGTTFCFTISLKQNSEVITYETPKHLETKNLIGKKILIVEDDQWSGQYLATVLAEKHIKTEIVRSGEEALQKLSNKEVYDMILMDIRLPGINGLETAAKIKIQYPDLPIIAQTAYALNEDRNKTLAAGCDEYLTKPIDTDKLAELLYKYVK
ncbi:MAG: ATP-binding protein, partial [Salinivirgaceae bacterium]